jgi:methyl acetate hydrolase
MHTKSAIDQALRGAAEAKLVPGVVAVAADDKGIIYEGAFGKRNLEAGAEMTRDSVFWIASMTKAVTSIAGMQMVEQGKLTLDDPIERIVPELKSPKVLEGFDANGNPKLRNAKRPITLRHLLTHTSGHGYDLFNPDLVKYVKHEGLPGIITCENAALRTPLKFDPGEGWEYGINIDFIGKAVERVSGKTLDVYLRDHILKPLGMNETGFVIRPDQRARLVSMHARQADGSLKPIPFEVPQKPEFFMGGAGLYGTASDYIKFCQMFLNDGQFNGARILRKETVEEIAKNQIGHIDVGALPIGIPELTNVAEFFPGMVKKWGFAFVINTEEAPTGRSAGSLAWAGLGNTYYWIDRRKRIAGVILMQLLPFADTKALDLLGKFETLVYSGTERRAAA